MAGRRRSCHAALFSNGAIGAMDVPGPGQTVGACVIVLLAMLTLMKYSVSFPVLFANVKSYIQCPAEPVAV